MAATQGRAREDRPEQAARTASGFQVPPWTPVRGPTYFTQWLRRSRFLECGRPPSSRAATGLPSLKRSPTLVLRRPPHEPLRALLGTGAPGQARQSVPVAGTAR